MWNGTADTLNAKPTITNTIASVAIGCAVIDPSSSAPIVESRVDPVTPYSSDMP